MTRWYIDTGVFVTPILKNRPQPVINACLEWQRRAASGEIEAVTSYLTWDEVAHVAGRVPPPFDRARAARFGQALLDCDWIDFVDVDDVIVAKAQSLLTRAGTGPRDCVHAATALLRTDGRMVTLDTGLAAEPGLQPHFIKA